METDSWNVQAYRQFLDLRTRPARDLLSVISDSFQPKIVYDLGCGPGNSTVLLKERWPQAKVIGIDSSPNMLVEARAAYPNIDFIEGDIAHFLPKEKIDCLFANASLQYLDDHAILIPKLLKCINSGGVFGIQMPNNFHAPLHQISVEILQSNTVWQPFLKELHYGVMQEPLYKLPWYYDLLKQFGIRSIQLWETEYFQEMMDHREIFDWVKGTGLRCVLSVMNAENQAKFIDSYIKFIAKAYSLQADNKILLPFKRIFMMGYQL